MSTYTDESADLLATDESQERKRTTFTTQLTSPDMFSESMSISTEDETEATQLDFLDEDLQRQIKAGRKKVVHQKSGNGGMVFIITNHEENEGEKDASDERQNVLVDGQNGSISLIRSGTAKGAGGNGNVTDVSLSKEDQDRKQEEIDERRAAKDDKDYEPGQNSEEETDSESDAGETPAKKSKSTMQDIDSYALATDIVTKLFGDPQNLSKYPCKVFYSKFGR